MIRSSLFPVFAIGCVALAPTQARAQYDNKWVTFAKDPNGVVSATPISSDADLDLVVSRKDGTELWRNDLSTPFTCQADLGFGTGPTQLMVCGGDLSTGSTATAELTGAVPNGLAFLFVGITYAPTYVPALMGTLVPVPPVVVTLATDFQGHLSFPVPGGGGPLSAYLQIATAKTVSKFDLSNAVRVDLLP